MANKSETKAEKTSKAEAEAFTASLAEMQKAGFGSMASFGTAWLEGVSDLSAEVLGFVADRIKEDVHTQHEMLHCKDLGELQKIQSRFIQKAIEQYTAETGKLVEMSNVAFTNAMASSKNDN